MFINNLKTIKRKYHPECIFNTDAFSLKISFDDDGGLTGRFDCNKKYQGYPGRIHGGILSAIIDSAMTQYLFGHNILAYTVRLNIKYSHPVEINKEAVIKVHAKEKINRKVCDLNASIYQDNIKLVTSEAKFWIDKILDLRTVNENSY